MRRLIRFLVVVPLIAALATMPSVASATPTAPFPGDASLVREAPVKGVPMYRFYAGAESPQKLIPIIRASLAKDPSGMTRLDEAKCRKTGDRSCARPIDFLNMLPRANQRAGITDYETMFTYMAEMVSMPAPPGEYWSGCTQILKNGTQISVLHCDKRAFHLGEQAWMHPQTAKLGFMAGCANPGDKPAQKPECYIVRFDYSEQRDVIWTQGYAAVSAHSSFTQEEVRSMFSDDCFFVADEDGSDQRKPDLRCGLLCPPGSEWPEAVLAAAVGLPELPEGQDKPPSTLWFFLKDGKGYLSLPRRSLEKLGAFVPCVYVERYGVSVPGYQGWSAQARFDVVVRREFVSTRASGKLGRVLKGGMHY